MSLKSLVVRHAPAGVSRRLRDLYFAIKLMPAAIHDYLRFLNHSGMNKSRDSREERAAHITLFCHQVEKGLSLPDPRPGFGMTVIPGLLDDVDAFVGRYGLTHPAATAIATLQAYLDHHERIAHPVDYVRDRYLSILEKYGLRREDTFACTGGVISLDRTHLLAEREAGFRRFFESRYSVRQFSGGVIPEADIRSAVRLAQKTPSVCNRQAWRVHAFAEPQQIARLLELQNGSKGFGKESSVLLAVTCELRSFLGVAERYQAWIDGGMFAMSLCLALHDLGYGSCCLNWSKLPSEDKAMHELASIPESEQIIVLLAVGTLPETFTVARSYRPDVDQVLSVHGSWVRQRSGVAS